MLTGFRDFLLRGNVVDLAVAVVVGAAFSGVVNALVKDMLTPLIAAIGGKPDFAALTFTINNSQFLYGDFLNAIISFIIVAAVIYYAVVLPMTAMMARLKPQAVPAPAKVRKCPECMSEIPVGARRCAFCTAVLVGAKSAN